MRKLHPPSDQRVQLRPGLRLPPRDALMMPQQHNGSKEREPEMPPRSLSVISGGVT